MLGSVSVNHSLTHQGVKMVPVNVGRTRLCAPAMAGMFGGDTLSIHLKVMAYTKVRQAPCWEVKCENCKLSPTHKYASNRQYIKCNNFKFHNYSC